jgi:hypothetical protein
MTSMNGSSAQSDTVLTHHSISLTRENLNSSMEVCIIIAFVATSHNSEGQHRAKYYIPFTCPTSAIVRHHNTIPHSQIIAAACEVRFAIRSPSFTFPTATQNIFLSFNNFSITVSIAQHALKATHYRPHTLNGRPTIPRFTKSPKVDLPASTRPIPTKISHKTPRPTLKMRLSLLALPEGPLAPFEATSAWLSKNLLLHPLGGYKVKNGYSAPRNTNTFEYGEMYCARVGHTWNKIEPDTFDEQCGATIDDSEAESVQHDHDDLFGEDSNGVLLKDAYAAVLQDVKADEATTVPPSNITQQASKKPAPSVLRNDKNKQKRLAKKNGQSIAISKAGSTMLSAQSAPKISVQSNVEDTAEKVLSEAVKKKHIPGASSNIPLPNTKSAAQLAKEARDAENLEKRRRALEAKKMNASIPPAVTSKKRTRDDSVDQCGSSTTDVAAGNEQQRPIKKLRLKGPCRPAE